ncbi:LysR family transcriptional regulator [Xanthobacter autotrophicus DSM 431]|uniref:LysR family transcriptional regulator n=1 Tax=Xanthobacter nonsaccharivorans TaxID=3119912 RepID=UPI003728305F
MLDWDDLRFFVELARCGSLSETARRLDADHSTVARRIAGLEAAVALKLFDRLPRGYALTEDGERLLERAGAVEQAVHGVERLASGAAAGISGRVRISAPPALASHWLVPRLAPLLARHPGLVLDVCGTPAAARLSRHEADLALRLSRPQEKGLVARRLGGLAYGLYGTRAYVEATPEPRRVFLGYDEELARSPQQLWLEALAQGRPMVFRSNDLSSLISAARAGMGLAALPHVLAGAADDLVCVANGDGVTRELWLLVHPDLRRAARVRAVMDHIIAVCRDMKTS